MGYCIQRWRDCFTGSRTEGRQGGPSEILLKTASKVNTAPATLSRLSINGLTRGDRPALVLRVGHYVDTVHTDYQLVLFYPTPVFDRPGMNLEPIG